MTMALLRPCGRLIQAFGKILVHCQVKYIAGVECVTRTQGYVTVGFNSSTSIASTESLEAPSNNVLTSKASSMSHAVDLQQKLVSLCLAAKNGRISNQDLLKIFESYVSNKGTFDESAGLAMLRYCGTMLPYITSTDRRIITSHVWKLIGQNVSALTLEHYNTLLSIHAQNNQTVDLKLFLKNMVVKPDGTTYKLLLKVAAKCGDVESAVELLPVMKNEGHLLSEEVFNLLILAHATNKDMKAALSALDTMKSARIEPSAETYANLAYGYASVGDIDSTKKILNAYPLKVFQIMEIVKCLSRSDLGQHIPAVMKYLPLSVIIDDAIFLSTVTELIHNGRPEDAFEVLNLVAKAATSDETNFVFDCFLKDMVRAKIPNSTVLKIMNSIMTTKNYPLAVADVCEGALRFEERELAMAGFEVMHENRIPVRPHYYWPLLIKASRGYGETDVFRTLKHMLCLNVLLDYDTLVSYVLPYVNTVDPFTTLRKFGDLGLENSVIFTPLLCYLLGQGNIKAVLSLCSKIKIPIDFARVLRPLVVAYKKSNNIDGCVKMFKYAPLKGYYPEEFLLILFGKIPKGYQVQLLNEFLRAFEAAKIPVSNFTMTDVQESSGAGEENDVMLVNPLDSLKPSYRVPHPRDMTLEELECHLIELKSKGMNLRGILRKLLQFHCRENNIKRVDELKVEYDKSGFEWTPGMYSSLLQLYVQNGRLEEAMTLYTQVLNCKDFKIDDFKIVELATALTIANRITDAFVILETSTSVGGARVSKSCWRLLDAVAHSTSYKLTERMLEVLVNAGFCEKSNTMLGPLVRAHLLRNDLASAVDTFTKCAEENRCTPLRQELVYALVKSIHADKSTKNENLNLLKKVQTITTNVRGNTNTKTDLLVSLARLDMTGELRKFLQNNAVTDNTLIRSLTLIPEDEKLPTLMTLLKASEGLSSVNRTSIYEYILSLHSRSGDCKRAIELWKQCLAEDQPVSRSFRLAFVSLLTNHNVPLPEVLSDTPKGLSDMRFDQ